MFSDKSPPQKLLVALIVLCGAGLITVFGFLPYTFSHIGHITSVIGALWSMWMIFPDFQYGMAVPVLVGFVVYNQRKKLATLPIQGWWPGMILAVLTMALFWAGHRVDNQYIGFFSIQLLLASLVLWLLGWRWLVALAFPLAFLAFAWPMPFLDNLVTFPLRMFMSGISVSVMNLFGLPTIQNGTGIFSAPNPGVHLAAGELFQVDVADPCSGIRSLYALMMISALYGYFTLSSPWRRAFLFLCSIPLAIAGNLARILILTLGIVSIGAPTAIGNLEHPTWFHEGAGFAVFLVALGGMILIGNLLNSSPSEWISKWRAVSSRPIPNPGATSSAHPREATPDIY